MKYLFFCMGLLLSYLFSSSQSLQHLELKLKQAKTEKEKIYALDSLAIYYTNYYLGTRQLTSDSFGYKQVSIASESRDRELMALALLLNGQRLSNSLNYDQSTPESIARADSFLVSTVELAQTNNLPLYEACAYLHLAELHLNPSRRNLDKALEQVHLAQAIIASLDNDSLDVLTKRYTAAVYQAKKNNVAAFRNFATALRKAEQMKNIPLQIVLTRDLNSFYMNLGDNEKTIDYALKALALSKQIEQGPTIYETHYMVVYSYLVLQKYDKAIASAQKLYALITEMGLPHTTRDITLLNIYISYVFGKNYKKAREFLAAHPGVEVTSSKIGLSYYFDFCSALLFQQEHRNDSAMHYFQKIVHTFNPATNPVVVSSVCSEYGRFLLQQGKAKEAIVQFEKAKGANEAIQDLGQLKESYQSLEAAYAALGNKSNAYDYHLIADKYRDSLQKLSDKKQLALLEVDNENKRLQFLQQQEEERTRNRHNLQYMGITAGIATIFILLTLLGFFSTSTAVIRGLGFFAFIFFFEFIILLADNQIHHWTHGEPWKVLAIKICLIAFLLPFHHYIEKRVVNYLVHRKKLQLHTGLLRRRKPVVTTVPPLTENTVMDEKQNTVGEQ